MSLSVPSSGDSHSMVALSVSISAITSPAETWSPFFFFHAIRVPSVIVSLSFGIWISGIIGSDELLNFSTRSRPALWQRPVFRRSAVPRARGVRYMAEGHLPVIRAESAHRAHRKYLFESGSKFLRQLRSTDGPVQQSPRDA